ncbi:MAG: ribonuclease J [Myxococcota bacterium]
MSEHVRFVPLGGLGEIGMNCMVVEYGADAFLIDCGITFPDCTTSVDVIHPCFDYLARQRSMLRALIVTHGHEDHIGAIPYLLEEFDLPIYGPRYALELIREKLHDSRSKATCAHLTELQPGRPLSLGALVIESYSVTHSIPDATGLILRTPHGVTVHSGDFKIDHAPPHGPQFDSERLQRLRGEDEVALLFSDSTNSLSAGRTLPEQNVSRALRRHIENASQLVVICQFSSNAHRLRSILEAALRLGRNVCLLGRSARHHYEIGVRTNVLPGFHHLLVEAKEARKMQGSDLLVVATGTQGERRGAIARLSQGTHRELELRAGDTVVFSSRVIPGNDSAVLRIWDSLARRGIHVVNSDSDPEIHASGHAHREEQRELIRMMRPRAFVPIHGARMHLEAHAELARSEGVPCVKLLENGEVLELKEGTVSKAGSVEAGRVFREWGDPVSEDVVRERQLLGELGWAIATVHINAASQNRCVDVITRGVNLQGSEEQRAAARDFVDRVVRKPGLESEQELKDAARRALKRWFAKRNGKTPLCSAIVVNAS